MTSPSSLAGAPRGHPRARSHFAGGDQKITASVKASDRPADLGPQDAVLVTLKASGQHALATPSGPCSPRHARRLRPERHSLVVWPWPLPRCASRPPDLSRLDRVARSPRRSVWIMWWARSWSSPNHVVEPGVVHNEVPDRNILWVGEPGRSPPRRASRRCGLP